MDYVFLASEITTDPTSVGYAAMTDAEIAVSLSAAIIRVRQRVTIERLQATAYQTGVATALNIAVQTPETPVEMRALCQTVLSIVESRLTDIDMDDPAAIAMFAALRQYGIISAQQAVAIDALATARTISRAEQIGLGATVSVEDIERSHIVLQLDALRERLRNGYNTAVASLDAASTVPEWSEIVAIIEAA